MTHDHPHEQPEQPMSEEEMRARLEEELRRITVRDVLLQTVVSLVNLAGQRLGLSDDTRELRDLGQVRMAIEAVRSLLPLLEEEQPEQVRPIRDALSQLQMAYAREAGGAAAPPSEGAPGEPREEAAPSGPKPSTGSHGGLWVPPGTDK